MRTITHFVLVLGCVIGAAACSPSSADAHPQKTQAVATKPAVPEQADKMPDEQADHIVEIHKMKFQTRLLNVKIGDTVTWINKDIVPHTATAKDKSWDSGQLKKGESFTLTITDQTSLDYFCFYHRQMKAKLVLTAND